MIRLWFFALAMLINLCVFSSSAFGQSAPDCSGDSLISESFSNGAKWEMCWESRIRENLVLSDVYYTPPNGAAKKILSSARLSQLHVAYDDSDVTYNDVTQFGLGGGYLVELDSTDCPFGDLLIIQTRPAICKWRSKGEDTYRTATRSVSAESLTLFSVSQVGAYAYIVTWKFYADGAIEPEVGATGALQRSSDQLELPFGRVLHGDDDTLWLSHTHNYYWRLDFDLGDSATDDAVTETSVQLNANGQRQTITERFSTEQARIISNDYPVSWEIWEKLTGATPGSNDTGYRIEPIHSGHKLERKDIEPYTEFDFFITVTNDCERFASQNARFNPDCLNEVSQYVNGESIIDADIALWHRVSFHHVPRNEDQRHMHTHWDGFTLEPINMHANTPGVDINSNTAPQLNLVSNQTGTVGGRIELQLAATDADGDGLSYTAENLPDGLQISDEGRIHGNLLRPGTFNVNVIATDDIASSAQRFSWNVTSADGVGTDGNSAKTGRGFLGSTGPVFLLYLLTLAALRLRHRLIVTD